MGSAVNSILGGGGAGGLLGAALNVAGMVFPPLGIATSVANMVTQGVGAAVNMAAQQLVKECGMPKFLGEAIGGIVKDALKDLIKPSHGGCDQAASQQFGGAIQDLIKDLAKTIRDGAQAILDQDKGDGKGGKCGKGGGKKESAGSWLEAIAKAMGEAAGNKAAKMVELSSQLKDISARSHEGMDDKAKTDAQAQDAKDMASVNAQFQAASQEFNMLQSAFSNAIKSIGEGMATMARKG